MAEPVISLAGRRVWVAGHRGLVGSALVRRLAREDCHVLTMDRAALDLRDQAATLAWVRTQRPEAIFLAAARVGGILANETAPADFLFDNLMIQANVIEAARACGVAKVVNVASSAVYPPGAPQPLREEALLSGPLEPTNEPYAVAKIAGIKLGQAYRRQHGLDVITGIPCNLYGPGDHYDPRTSHVLPSLIRRAHEAKAAGAASLTIWGSGAPRREFLHVDDAADALVWLTTRYSGEAPINIGAGEDRPIAEVARLVCEVIGFQGEIALDPSKPDGAARRLMDTSRLTALGWRPSIGLREGISNAYVDFLARALG